MTKTNINPGNTVLFFDEEGESTFIAKFLFKKVDGGGYPYYRLEINEVDMDIPGVLEDSVKLIPSKYGNNPFYMEEFQYYLDNLTFEEAKKMDVVGVLEDIEKGILENL